MKLILFVICFLTCSSGMAIADTLNGHGAACFSDGSKYVGQFKDGVLNGQGKINFADGSCYTGGFLAGEMNGHGTMIFSDGIKYIGQFKNGMFHGEGKITFPDGSVYEGQFENDTYHGQGTWSAPYGITYVGQFKNGKFDGQGVYTLPDGSRYIGLFKDDHFYGNGAWDRDDTVTNSDITEEAPLDKETASNLELKKPGLSTEAFSGTGDSVGELSNPHDKIDYSDMKSLLESDADDPKDMDKDFALNSRGSDNEETVYARTTLGQTGSVEDTSNYEENGISQSERAMNQSLMPGSEDGPPNTASNLSFSVQVGAFLSQTNAEKLTRLLIEKGYSAVMVPMLDCIDRPWYTVRIGNFPTFPQAKKEATAFSDKEKMVATVRPVDSL